MNNIYIVDIETSSSIDLTKHGSAAYIADPSFKILIKARKKLKKSEAFLEPILAIKDIYVAHNALFEDKAFRKLDQTYFFICTAFLSRWLGGPSSLDQCATYWKLSSLKSSEGKSLIKYFNQYPQPSSAPCEEKWIENFEKFKAYCYIDVKITEELFLKLMRIISLNMSIETFKRELCFFRDTHHLNLMRGAKINTDKILSVKKDVNAKTDKILKMFHDQYNVNPRSPKQVKEWVYANRTSLDPVVESTDKKALAVIKPQMSKELKQFFNRRELVTSNIPKKLDKLLNEAVDGYISPNLVHFGTASGRYVSRGVNILNFPRANKKNIEDFLKTDKVKLKDLNSILRSFIVNDPAIPGGKIVSVDYKQIELRVLLYLLKKFNLLDKLYNGYDLYTNFAKFIYPKSPTITKEQRFIGKVCVLSLGYGAGVKRLAMELGNLEAIPALMRGQQVYLKMLPEIKKLWLSLHALVRDAPTKPYIALPIKGREIIRYLDYNKLKIAGSWTRTPELIGAQVLSITCQSIVREIMADKKHELLKKGFNILWDVHDEIVFNERPTFIEPIRKIMEEPLEWLPKFKLQTDTESEGYWL